MTGPSPTGTVPRSWRAVKRICVDQWPPIRGPPFTQNRANGGDRVCLSAYSGDDERSFRRKVNTCSGERER